MPQNMRRNILEVRAVACRGKASLDILQPRAILIYDEPDVRTAGTAGTGGNTQGDKNEMSPAMKATAIWPIAE